MTLSISRPIQATQTIILTAEQFENHLAASAKIVEAALDGLLAASAASGEITRPVRLLEAMRYASLGGGKRLRPFLLIETARMFGATGAGIVQAACALECVHCYSLIHDDLPAMDDDDLRRGKPTVHKAFDDATAILAGDALLTLAFAAMSDRVVHDDSAVRGELVQGLAQAAGIGGMAGGQMRDLQAERAVERLGLEDILQLQAMKTGALIGFACEAGAIIGAAGANGRTRLRQFGELLGLIFQITDDLLDAQSDVAALGKAAGKDAARNKATLVALLGIDKAKSLRDERALQAAMMLDEFGEDAAVLRGALQFASTRVY